MVAARSARRAGPCNNKLDSLGRSLEGVRAAGKVVLLLSDVTSKHQEARKALGLESGPSYLVSGSPLDCKYGRRRLLCPFGGRCQQGGAGCGASCERKATQQQRWAEAVCRLFEVACQHDERSLDTLPSSHRPAALAAGGAATGAPGDGGPTAAAAEDPGTALEACEAAWAVLQDQQSKLLAAREATRAASDAMRAWLREQGEKLATGFDTQAETPAEVVDALRGASQVEGAAEKSMQAMATELAALLAKAHVAMHAELLRLKTPCAVAFGDFNVKGKFMAGLSESGDKHTFSTEAVVTEARKAAVEMVAEVAARTGSGVILYPSGTKVPKAVADAKAALMRDASAVDAEASPPRRVAKPAQPPTAADRAKAVQLALAATVRTKAVQIAPRGATPRATRRATAAAPHAEPAAGAAGAAAVAVTTAKKRGARTGDGAEEVEEAAAPATAPAAPAAVAATVTAEVTPPAEAQAEVATAAAAVAAAAAEKRAAGAGAQDGDEEWVKVSLDEVLRTASPFRRRAA